MIKKLFRSKFSLLFALLISITAIFSTPVTSFTHNVEAEKQSISTMTPTPTPPPIGEIEKTQSFSAFPILSEPVVTSQAVGEETLEALSTSTDLLQNGSFELGLRPPDFPGYLTLKPGDTSINNWTVISSSVSGGGGGGIDYYGIGWRSSDGSRSLDLNGTPGVGGIYQDFTTTPGLKYVVSFDMAGHPSGLLQKMKVSAIALGNPTDSPTQEAEFFFLSGTDPNNLGWQRKTWEFTAETPQTRLQFESYQTFYRFGGPALDNVVAVASITCQVSPSGLNSCDPKLQKGDILLLHATNPLSVAEAHFFSGYWSHAGIYNGDGTITEAYPYYPNGTPFNEGVLIDTPGVIVNPVAQSVFWNNDVDDWAILRVNSLTEAQKQNAIVYAKDKSDGNHLYNYEFWDKLTEAKFYCSQLVWRAFEKQGVNLDSNISALSLFTKNWLILPLNVLIGENLIKDVVPPDDIYFSPNVTKVMERPGLQNSIRRWVFRLLSPAKLLVTDPYGRQTGYDSATNSTVQEIHGSLYSGFDTEPQVISIREMGAGIWKFQVVGTGTGSYTFLAESVDRDTHTIIPAAGTIKSDDIANYELSISGDGSQPILTQIIDIEIKPGSNPAPINLKSNGVMPVAILSNNVFDATTIDPSSVKFGPNGVMEIHKTGHLEDVNSDGKVDMVLHFNTQGTGIKSNDTKACLTGKTRTGINIQGCDDIRIVGN